jgi:DNA-binding transcriptional MocR family regulator
VYKILSEGHYRKHVDRIRVKLDGVRDQITKRLENLGMKVEHRTPAGMFLWTDTGLDTNKLTEKALEQGYLLAPGSLFSPQQLPSTRMRINIAAMSDPGVWDFLQKAMK